MPSPRQAHRAGSSRCSSWMAAHPPGSREKRYPGRASKGNGNTRAESRGICHYIQTPSTKSFVPARSQMPRFLHQCLRAGNLSTFIILCFTACSSSSRLSPSNPSSAPPAQIPTRALHSPHSSRHLNQLPTTIPAPRTHPSALLPHLDRVSVLTLHFLVIYRFANKLAML